jgi:RNA recognition motif-containing protein
MSTSAPKVIQGQTPQQVTGLPAVEVPTHAFVALDSDLSHGCQEDGTIFAYPENSSQYLSLVNELRDPATSVNRKSLVMRLSKLNGQLIFIRGVKKYTKPKTIERTFSRFGQLLHIHFPYNPNNKKNIGYGYVAFVDPEVGRYLLEEVKSVSIDGKKVELRRFVEKNLTDSSDLRVEETKPKEPTEKTKGKRSLLSRPSFDAFICKEDGHDCTTPGSASATDVHSIQDIHCTKPTNKRYFQYDRSFSRTRASDAANLAFRVLKPQSNKRSYQQQRQVNKCSTYSPYFLGQPVTF